MDDRHDISGLGYTNKNLPNEAKIIFTDGGTETVVSITTPGRKNN